MHKRFSDRYGYSPTPEITIREDAPEGLRRAILAIATNQGMALWEIRDVVRDVLSPYSTSSRGGLSTQLHITICPWYKVYNVAEVLHEALFDPYDSTKQQNFADRLNQYFRENGIGWEMRDGQIVYRGSEVFAETDQRSRQCLGRIRSSECRRVRCAKPLRISRAAPNRT